MRFSAILFCVAVTLAMANSATAADYGQKPAQKSHKWWSWGDKEVWREAHCDSPKILKLISRRFEASQEKTFHRELSIVSLNDPQRYHRHENDPKFHDRQFCRAHAHLSNGTRHTVYYLLNHDGNPPLSNGLVFCIPAYDYFRAYAPDCRQVRPH